MCNETVVCHILLKVGIKVAPRIRDHLMPCFDDFLQTYTQVFCLVIWTRTCRGVGEEPHCNFKALFTFTAKKSRLMAYLQCWIRTRIPMRVWISVPKSGYSNDWGSRSGVCAMETVPTQYNVAIRFQV